MEKSDTLVWAVIQEMQKVFRKHQIKLLEACHVSTYQQIHNLPSVLQYHQHLEVIVVHQISPTDL